MIEVDPVNEATPVFAATYSSPNPDVDEDAAVGTDVVDVSDSDLLIRSTPLQFFGLHISTLWPG